MAGIGGKKKLKLFCCLIFTHLLNSYRVQCIVTISTQGAYKLNREHLSNAMRGTNSAETRGHAYLTEAEIFGCKYRREGEKKLCPVKSGDKTVLVPC